MEVGSIDASGIHIAENSSATVLPWDDVLELSQNAVAPSAPTGRLSLVFRRGDTLSGEPILLGSDTLHWQNARLGEINFPIDSLLAIIRSGSSVADLDQNRPDDIVRLANGDTTHGIITQIAPGGVTIQAADGTPTLPWDSITAVLFSTAPANPNAPRGRMFRVQFTGDESLTVQSVALVGDKLTISMDDKNSRQIDAATVAGIEQINGPIEWLTARTPAENIYKPFFSENFPTRFDRTVADDKPIREKYPAFHHGIGCHSYSKLVYDLDGKWAGFRTQFAIDSDSPLADVTVRIYLDDKVAFQRVNVKAGRIYPLVLLPLAGAKTLSLEVDYGENYATEDRFVWLDPALIRTLRQPTTQP
ncbi:MAG TPA: NPCBM/NEW2 domain-containing protein [Tepidisphaeraceae bacterium]|nr:NPCBM/NEW2 domain-containing protein [Tepidisphaeraceae bacterium]